MKIPEWMDCQNADCSGVDLDPLQRFVMDNEPAGTDEELFRRQLTELVKFIEESAAPTPPAQEADVNTCTSNPVVAHETGNVNNKQDREVGILYVSLFRGHLENTHFDYYGDLPEGSHELYTRPDNSELRNAAEEALWYLSLDVGKPERGQRIEANLRAALEGK